MSVIEENLARIRARGPLPLEQRARLHHRKTDIGMAGQFYCMSCRNWWPCLTIQLADEVERLKRVPECPS